MRTMDAAETNHRMLKRPTCGPTFLLHNTDMELVDAQEVLLIVLSGPGVSNTGY